MNQQHARKAMITFDQKTETSSIVSKDILGQNFIK